jgi:hypothetical protein
MAAENTSRLAVSITALLMYVLGFAPHLVWGQSAQLPPNELVRRVVDNELKAEDQDHSHWMFRLETENKNGQKEVNKVVETKDGDVKLPLVLSGQPVTDQQKQETLQKLSRNPQSMRQSLKDKNQDAERSQRLLKMLPDAFLFQYGKRQGSLVQLTFKPDPKFRPNNREAEVFHAMEGELWVDDKDNRLAGISGTLMQRVKFGGGLLGRLEKGGTFEVKQQRLESGYWELTVLNVEMKGRALFFKTISVHQRLLRTDFKLVPNDLSLQSAIEMLKKSADSEKVARY